MALNSVARLRVPSGRIFETLCPAGHACMPERRAAVVVIEHRLRHPAKESESVDMAIHPCLRRRCGIGPHEAAIAVRQVHDEEVGLLFDGEPVSAIGPRTMASDHHDGFAEIRLRVPRRVGERHEHLSTPPPPIPDIVLDDRVAASEAMLFAPPIKHPPGGMVLLAMHVPIPVEPGVDDLGEPIQLRPLDRNLAPVAGGTENASAWSTVSRGMSKWRAAARLLRPPAQTRRTFR